MPAGRYNITIEQGARFDLRVAQLNESYGDHNQIRITEGGIILVGQPDVGTWQAPLKDYSDYFARMCIRHPSDDSLIAILSEINGRIHNRRALGHLILNLTAIETAALDFTRGKYDLELVGHSLTLLTQGAAGNECVVETQQVASTRDSGTADFPATTSNDWQTGDLSWADDDNIKEDDARYANPGTLNAGLLTDFIRAVNFGLSVPERVEIKGIEIKVERGTGAGGTIEDYKVYLLKKAIYQIAENKAAAGAWPLLASIAVATYGGSADLWSETWYPQDFLHKDFGVVLQAKNTHADSNTLGLYIDYITARVYYWKNGRLIASGVDPFATLSAGDYIHIANSTGGNEGIYEVEEKVNNNQIILTSPLLGSDTASDATITVSKITLNETGVIRLLYGNVTLKKEATYA